MLIFDFGIYDPTKKGLEDIAPRVTKGSVVAFDELNGPGTSDETLTVMEAIDPRNIRLQTYPHASRVFYFVVE